jgi:hypothetical protein
MSDRNELNKVAFAQLLRLIPGYPFLPCPICNGIEGCDHIVAERALAANPGASFVTYPVRH